MQSVAPLAVSPADLRGQLRTPSAWPPARPWIMIRSRSVNTLVVENWNAPGVPVPSVPIIRRRTNRMIITSAFRARPFRWFSEENPCLTYAHPTTSNCVRAGNRKHDRDNLADCAALRTLITYTQMYVINNVSRLDQFSSKTEEDVRVTWR